MSHVWVVACERDCEPGVFVGVNATRAGAVGNAFWYMLGTFGCQYKVTAEDEDRIEWRHQQYDESVIAERHEIGP